MKAYVGLGGGSIFTGIVYCLGILFLYTSINIKLGFKPNIILLQVGGAFFCQALLYFFIYNMERRSFTTDSINFLILFFFFLFLLRVDNEVQKYLPTLLLFTTFITSIALLYSIYTNPEFVLGSRATVQYKSNSGEFTGNPHIYSRNGLAGFIISVLLIIYNSKNIFLGDKYYIRILSHFNMLISLLVIILTQTRATILSLGLISLLMVVYVLKLRDFFINIRTYVFIYYSFLIVTIIYLEEKYKFWKLVVNYYNSFLTLFSNAVLTGVSLGKSSELDASAMGRVSNINYFVDLFKVDPWGFILGHGYKKRYIDIPILESFINFGFLGFFTFVLFNSLIFYFCIKALSSRNVFQVFIGLFYIHTLVATFVAGRPVDFSFWVTYIVLIRFLGIEYIDKKLL
ncbi:hypothetical protein [Aquirufa sp.]|uniref:hypothetical protein n=1 Tax=Aquirufa sp. TaxID=2676249 RepID=UPI0037BFBA99